MVENGADIQNKVMEELHRGINHYGMSLFFPQAITLEQKGVSVPVLCSPLGSGPNSHGTTHLQLAPQQQQQQTPCPTTSIPQILGSDSTLTSGDEVKYSPPALVQSLHPSSSATTLLKGEPSIPGEDMSQNLCQRRVESTTPTPGPSRLVVPAMTVVMRPQAGGVPQEVGADLPVKMEALNSETPPPSHPGDAAPMFRCFQCEFVTSYKAALKTHALIHSDTPTKVFRCSECHFETNWRHNFRCHAELHHSAASDFKCPECGFESTWKNKFDYHLLLHSSPVMLKCEECDFESNWRSDLDRHLEIHSGTKRFRCADCCLETNWKNEFVYHLLLHTSAKVFKCGECGFKTSRKGNLTRHLLIHSSDLPKRYKCDQCGFNTHWNYKLTAHMVTHADEVPKLFKCHECAFETHRKGNLTRHSLIHSTASKRLKCSECGYKTHWNYKLTAHMVKHTERSFNCPHCAYKATSKTDLKKHTLAQHSPPQHSPTQELMDGQGHG